MTDAFGGRRHQPTIGGVLRTRMRARRRRWRVVLGVGGLVVVAYYGLVLASIRNSDASAVPLDDQGVRHTADRVTLQVRAANLDPATGSLDIRVRPVPHGSLTGELGGQLRRALRMQVRSPGEPPTSFDFPADQIVDPVATSVAATTRARSFPFDRPQAVFWLEAFAGDRPVPIDVQMVDETEEWELKALARGDDDALRVQVRAHREPLAVGMALLLIVGIAVVGMITVAVVGGSLVRREVDFDRVIWLGAMLVAIPAVRNEMPGVPPIGTGVDLFVVFPSVVVVALALLAGVVVLAINEAKSNADPGSSETTGDVPGDVASARGS